MTNDHSILPDDWPVPPTIRARFGKEAGRQRMMAEAGHLLLVLHEAPEVDATERKAKLFWRSPEGAWHASGTAETGISHLQHHVESYVEAVEQLEKQLDVAQQAKDFFRVLRASVPLSRAIRNMHNTLQQARDTFKDVKELIIFRDEAYHLGRRTELLEAETKNALDFTVAERAEEEAQYSKEMVEASYRINLLAAIFLPITALATLFGMSPPRALALFDTPVTFWAILLTGTLWGYYLKASLQKKTQRLRKNRASVK